MGSLFRSCFLFGSFYNGRMKKKTPQFVVQVYLALLQSKKPLTVTQLVEVTNLPRNIVFCAVSGLIAEQLVTGKITQKQLETASNDMKLIADGKNPPLRKETKWYAV